MNSLNNTNVLMWLIYGNQIEPELLSRMIVTILSISVSISNKILEGFITDYKTDGGWVANDPLLFIIKFSQFGKL